MVTDKEIKRFEIVDAGLTLMREAGEDAVTIARVAAAAGVSERTVYRHFGSRDGLIRAVWRRMREQIGPRARPETTDALIERPRRLFPRLDRDRELVRAYLYSRERRQGRLRPSVERQQAMLQCVREELPYLDEDKLRRRAAIAQLIASSYAWEMMQESWGFNGDEAGAAAAEALEILLNRRLAY